MGVSEKILCHITWLVRDTRELCLEEFSLLPTGSSFLGLLSLLPPPSLLGLLSLLTIITPSSFLVPLLLLSSSLVLLKSSLLIRACSLKPPLFSASPDKEASAIFSFGYIRGIEYTIWMEIKRGGEFASEIYQTTVCQRCVSQCQSRNEIF